MNVLVLNGSPRGEKSNTMKLTRTFIDGMREVLSLSQEILTVSKMNIKSCTGCFHCWSKTPGKCCISDDMASVIEKILASDVIIWSFPLYYYGLPSHLKALMDRQLPMLLPFMAKGENIAESGAHPSRYDLSNKRWALISTCGFYTAKGNYDSVFLQFDHYLGKGNYEFIASGEGELFQIPEFKKRTEEYLAHVKTAGSEFAFGAITSKTKAALEELLFPRDAFEQMADASWGLELNDPASPEKANDPSFSFTKQMAALYNSSSWDGKDRVLEMCYTDVNKAYQILLTRNGTKVLTDDFLPYTTKIETPLALWMSIAKGETDGQNALIEQRYRVEGDFQLMVRWDDYFGVPEKPAAREKKSLMLLMLLPWFPIWFFMALNPVAGGILGIGISAFLPFFSIKYKTTIYEYISGFLVSIIGILALQGVPVHLLVPGSYLLFGLMWSTSVFLRIPLTANYSMNNYGEDKALQNPLFIKTNRILTACWGTLYILTPIWTFFLLKTSNSFILTAANTLLPALLGIFTEWFQKWYPSFLARRKKR